MTIKQDIKELINTEKRIMGLIKKDSEIVEAKSKEKDIAKLLTLVEEQEVIDEREIQSLEAELKEEEGIIDEERAREAHERKKRLKELEESELLDEIHHLRIVYVLIPLIRQKNESLKKQKELLAEVRGEFTIADLPMLIGKEKEVLEKIEVYEEEAENILKKIERKESEEAALRAAP